jgi:citrate synthase
MSTTTIEDSRPPAGLRGLVVTDTSIGDVRGEEGLYHYRQYNAVELAERHDFEDVWLLLLNGVLPGAADRATFLAALAELRQLPSGLAKAVATIAAAGGQPLDQLRSAISLTAAQRGCRPVLDLTPAERRADVIALSALVPTLVAALWRAGRGLALPPARADLGHAAHYLYLIRGEEAPPDEIRAVEQYLISTIDHGFNASTFTARVVASTGADVGACLVAAIGALSGPLHGGAPTRALELMEEVSAAGGPAAAARVTADKLARGEKLMGFGHAVYRGNDPRAELLHRTALRLGGPRIAQAEAVESAITEALRDLKPGRRLGANVEFYAGVVMERCQLPAELFTPTFAVSRAVGWGAHVLEQAAEGRLIRPSARYIGPWPLQPVP